MNAGLHKYQGSLQTTKAKFRFLQVFFFSPLFPLEFPIFDSTAVEALISDSFHTSSEI